ncbi:uncharacterized protein CLUP02_16422 [Colletotrichum lupini]|uniref:Uncharacterized protein n=1 Tax=Colletotrichum lupini TaxID=145971 RepID=A0A9Q8WQ52_9PEZI|nr:uncharacterized protein CLUP02_16422 [Colletotrichum lupini]UQC90890.1 hypothetical protein CLUP02_16422 [Colletotrichum lupini]
MHNDRTAIPAATSFFIIGSVRDTERHLFDELIQPKANEGLRLKSYISKRYEKDDNETGYFYCILMTPGLEDGKIRELVSVTGIARPRTLLSRSLSCLVRSFWQLSLIPLYVFLRVHTREKKIVRTPGSRTSDELNELKRDLSPRKTTPCKMEKDTWNFEV